MTKVQFAMAVQGCARYRWFRKWVGGVWHLCWVDPCKSIMWLDGPPLGPVRVLKSENYQEPKATVRIR